MFCADFWLAFRFCAAGWCQAASRKPKELAKLANLPVSLEVLNLSGGSYSWEAHKPTGGIPSEWSALTNLKELTMENCGLDGKPPGTRTERLPISS